MKHNASRFMIAAAILASPAAGTALETSVYSIPVESQPGAPADISQTATAAGKQAQALLESSPVRFAPQDSFRENYGPSITALPFCVKC
ncbi:hypothetical protein [Paenibacillus lutrae]|uniref:Uncharacterized protein n=1 Tax=Paenibacillus lutrae TaxID=2078573 RepID=A0A7X3FG88_9BACL|nr:hypothetical protein [Paenibacillus lutrae]MVO98831.1 hypothetical protein [Paenibacillus lutrae]